MKDVTENDMMMVFSQFGVIKSVSLPKDCSFAFIDFEDSESVIKAIKYSENNQIKVKEHIFNPGQPSTPNRGESEKRKASDVLNQNAKIARTDDNLTAKSKSKKKKLFCKVCQIPLGFQPVREHCDSSRHEDNTIRVLRILGIGKGAKLDSDSAWKLSMELNLIKKIDHDFVCLVCDGEKTFNNRHVSRNYRHVSRNYHKKMAENALKNDRSNYKLRSLYIVDLNNEQSSEASHANKNQNISSIESGAEIKENNLDPKRGKYEELQVNSEYIGYFSCESCNFSGPISELSKHKSNQDHIEKFLPSESVSC